MTPVSRIVFRPMHFLFFDITISYKHEAEQRLHIWHNSPFYFNMHHNFHNKWAWICTLVQPRPSPYDLSWEQKNLFRMPAVFRPTAGIKKYNKLKKSHLRLGPKPNKSHKLKASFSGPLHMVSPLQDIWFDTSSYLGLLPVSNQYTMEPIPSTALL